MKTLILMLSFIGAAAHGEPYSETFTKLTGIEPGAYELKRGSEDCESGDLVLKDKVSSVDKQTPGIAFVLNSHVLAGFLGGKDSGGERELKWTSKSTVRAGKVEYRKRGTFEGKPIEWSLVITPKPDGFTYLSTADGKSITCELHR